MREIGGRELMRPRRRDAAIANARTTSGSAQCGQRLWPAVPRRQISDVAQRMFVRSVPSTAQASSSRPKSDTGFDTACLLKPRVIELFTT